MQIDWLTVAAQIVNFLVLVWLLKRFLYGPIIRAMDRREELIAERLEEGERKARAADEEAEVYRERSARLEETRERVLKEAESEAEERRRALQQEIRKEMEGLREKWRDEIQAEQQAFLADVRRDTLSRFLELARRALGDLAGTTLEAQMAECFIERLQDLDEAARRRLRQAIEAGDPVTVRSAFDLDSALRGRITRAFHEAVARDVEVSYERTDDIACGLALRAGGQTVQWSLDGYLEQFEERLEEAIRSLREKRGGPAPVARKEE